MKNKFEIKSILGNSQKRTYRREVFRQKRAGFVLCLIIMSLLYCAFTVKTSPKTIGQTIDNKVVVNATEDKYSKRGYPRCFDVITCIRDIGEELGIDNKDILIAIRIAKAESGMRTDAIGKNTNGTYDMGVFQINDVHAKRISREDRLDYEKNIRFAFKLRQEQGNWNAWSVCRNKVDCR